MNRTELSTTTTFEEPNLFGNSKDREVIQQEFAPKLSESLGTLLLKSGAKVALQEAIAGR